VPPLPAYSSNSTVSVPPYTSRPYHYNPSPVGPGTAPGYNSTDVVLPTGTAPHRPAVTACAGQTLDVLGASLDWWYPRTVYNIVSTISIQFNKNDSQVGWTLLPATTSFDLNAALASPTCVGTETWNTVFNMTLWDYECNAAPTPVAASTTVIGQKAYALNATTGRGHPPDAVVTPTPAAITIPQAGGSYSAGTAFVYFSKYEILTKSPATYGNGSVGCATVTLSYDMAEPFSFEYTGGDVNGSSLIGAGVTGDVNPAFLGVVNATKAKAGSWVAAPTVALVVQDIVAEIAVLAAARPGFAPLLTTETVLQTPSATLPNFDTPPIPPPTPDPLSPTPGFTGRVESTQTKLQVPTPPNPPPKPAQPTQKPNPPNTPQPGRPTNVPNPPPGQSPTQGGSPPTTTTPGRIGQAFSIIFSAIRPTTTTNALSILESAAETFQTTANPTAAAILHGVQGPQGTPAPGSPGSLGPIVDGQKNGVGVGPDGRPVVVVDGTTFTGNSRTQFVLGPGQTLTPGGVAQIDGTSVSLAPGMTAVVVADHTFNAASAQITSPPSLTIGGKVFAPVGGSTYNIGGQQLTPGGVIVADGTTISLAPGAAAVVVDGSTQYLDNGVTAAPVLFVGGESFTANNGGTFVVDGQTLTPGGVIIVNGTTVSLESGATAVVIDGQTSTLVGAAAAGITDAPALTIGSETFTAMNAGGTYVIDGKTLTPGNIETVTVDGKVYIVSLSPDAMVLKIETEGPGGAVTATMFETLYPGGAGAVTSTVGAAAGSSASAGPSASVVPALANAAESVGLHLGGLGLAAGTLFLAVWL